MRLIDITVYDVKNFKHVIDIFRKFTSTISFEVKAYTKKRNVDDDEETDNERSGIIKLIGFDSCKVSLGYLVLKESEFLRFDHYPDRYAKSLEIDELYRYIKTVDDNDSLNIYVDSDDTTRIMFQTLDHDQIDRCVMHVVDIEVTPLKIEPDVSFAIHIPTKYFHKAVRNIYKHDSYVNIVCESSCLVISSTRDPDYKEVFKNNTDATIKPTIIATKNNIKKVGLCIDLKYIAPFYKSIVLCEHMEIYMHDNFPMILRYGVGEIGELYVFISPCIV